MTISYQYNVATASFAGFPRLLARWKGSVYKLVFKEVLVYAGLYVLMSIMYRIGLNEEQRRFFEKICLHMEVSVNFIPLTFVLGFYVSFVVGRWWDQFSSYPWPDRLCFLIVLYINGHDEKSRLIRRTLVRYLNASTVLLARSVSIVAKKRFPTTEHLVEAGLLTKDEFKLFESINTQYAKFWVPLVWFTKLVDKAKTEQLFHDPSGGMKQVLDELMSFRDRQGKIWAFDYVSIPIVYTQVVTLATYMYFVGCLFSRQFLDPEQKYENYHVDIYVPVFTLLQFFFYVGWLKVAESLINPWGEDDDDFEVNWLIDRHMQVSYAIVDDMSHQLPALEKDKYWNEKEILLPYTEASLEAKKKPFSDLGSTMNLNIPASSRPMRRMTMDTTDAMGSSADLVVRRRYFRRRGSENDPSISSSIGQRKQSSRSFTEISVAVPVTPSFGESQGFVADNSGITGKSDDSGYLTPGFPAVPSLRGENELDLERHRKISSPARMSFFVPDGDALASYNSRNARLDPIQASDADDDEAHAHVQVQVQRKKSDVKRREYQMVLQKPRQGATPPRNASSSMNESSEPLLSRPGEEDRPVSMIA